MAALVTVLPLQRAVDFTSRQVEQENTGFLVPNLADILGFSSPALHGDLAGFGGYPQEAPLFFGVWFVAVVVWLVPWRRAVLVQPAFVASLVGLLLTLLFTQASSNLGPLRWPIRMLPGVPLFVGVSVAVAVAALGLRLSRGRVVGAIASLLAGTVLTFFRDPTNGIWLPAGLVTLAAARCCWPQSHTGRGASAAWSHCRPPSSWPAGRSPSSPMWGWPTGGHQPG